MGSKEFFGTPKEARPAPKRPKRRSGLLFAAGLAALSAGLAPKAEAGSAQMIEKNAPSTREMDSEAFLEMWNGYGSTSWEKGELTLSPEPARERGETHSALVLSREEFHPPYRLHFQMVNKEQLRQGSKPNPWEVGWFVLGYNEEGKFKYVIVKPNGKGLEIGESLLNDKQNFLWTSIGKSDPYPIGSPLDVDVRVTHDTIHVFVNGKEAAKHKLSKKDKLGLDGRIGFYTEDAAVRVSDIRIEKNDKNPTAVSQK